MKAQQLPSGNYRVVISDGYKENGKRNYKSFTAQTEYDAIVLANQYLQQIKKYSHQNKSLQTKLPDLTLEEKLDMLNKGYYELTDDIMNRNKIQYLNKTYYEVNTKLRCQPDTYFISLDGEIYSRHIERTMSLAKNKDGYLYCAMATPDNKKVKVSVAKIMLMTFRGEPPANMEHPSTEHLNGIRDDNWIMNLIWMEHGENSSCRRNKGKGENNPKAKLNENKVHEICSLLEKGGYTTQKIADMYGVGKGCIESIKHHKNWIYISDQYNF